ncbi:hypothetical protein OG897_40515 [Streptomyces sp. NBC_00237]|nr:hypothetical protein [Streptomyces sp. NBC_00237]MCX5207670.1 hypothetical protein [Streptomyces sp. NBC_00237]
MREKDPNCGLRGKDIKWPGRRGDSSWGHADDAGWGIAPDSRWD